jgi:hypothetical protein
MEESLISEKRPAADSLIAVGAARLPALPWRDPQSVPPEKLAELIVSLKQACAREPQNAALRTCLGMAHAMNYDVYASMAALEAAIAIAPRDFLARLKYGELFYRLRVRNRAEKETLCALELACSRSELSLARKQLAQIRQLDKGGASRPEWTKSLRLPATALVALLFAVAFVYMFWK